MRRFGLVLATAFALLGAGPLAAQDYVGTAACAACHADAVADWQGSHHALAWTEATPGTIVADFDGTVFTHDGMTARFRISPDGTYHVAVTEKDGVTTDYQVHSVAGIEPLQQYLLETEPGRLQSFDVVWDTETGLWFHLYPDQDLPPRDALHWTGPYKNWNARCAECHATGYEKNYDPVTRTYASIQAEIGVGCEACHGPGSAHLDWAGGGGIVDSGADLDAYGFSQSFATTEATIQQCATCHSRREAHTGASPVPGTPYHDSYNLALLRPGLYFPDGQILEEVYVYGSFLQSKMYAAGVGCVDCHDAHTALRIAEGNAVCTQCHSSAGNPRFATLSPADYDSPAHHFHGEGTAGAQCKSCHAPERVYMGNDWRADHSFRVPRPDLSVETGAPNACTTCHTDRDAAWAAAELEARFPESRHRGPHFGQVLARGRENAVAAAGDLADLATDTEQSALVRATALWLLENANSPSTATRLAPLVDDPDPLVRAAAAGLQRSAPPADRLTRIVGLLTDPVRNVRTAAATLMMEAPIARLPRQIQSNLNEATSEWRRSLASRLDFPETHLQLGGWALVLRNFPAAVQAFETAVALDPQRADAWVMLVRIAAATEGPASARAVLDTALAALPDDETLRGFDRDLP
ncbi:MAG: multiheme c-type cytochrome [Pseudomonadota bacterium]